MTQEQRSDFNLRKVKLVTPSKFFKTFKPKITHAMQGVKET
jgi:hypothetical protein